MSLAARLLPVFASRRRFSVGLSSLAAAGSGNGNGPYTTSAVTATIAGGVSPFTYAWARVSGDASIAISNAASASPTWSASGTAPQTKTAGWQCTVTDAAGVARVTAIVTVTIQFQVSDLSADVTDANPSGGGDGTAFSTPYIDVLVSGGVGPYAFLWVLVSGSGAPGPNDSTSSHVYFAAIGTPPETKASVWRCRITDALGSVTYTPNVTATINFTQSIAPLAVDLSSTSTSGSFTDYPGVSGTATSDAVTATPSGGVGPYVGIWERMSGDTATAVSDPAANTVQFSRAGTVENYQQEFPSTWRRKVTDSAGTVAYSANVQAYLTIENNI